MWIAKPSSWTSSTKCLAGVWRWSRGSNSTWWIGSTGGRASGAKPSGNGRYGDGPVDVWRGRIKCEVQPSSTFRWDDIYNFGKGCSSWCTNLSVCRKDQCRWRWIGGGTCCPWGWIAEWYWCAARHVVVIGRRRWPCRCNSNDACEFWTFRKWPSTRWWSTTCSKWGCSSEWRTLKWS